jgi:hypothetical protein
LKISREEEDPKKAKRLESQISQKDKKDEKAGEKIIVKEKMETGNVKLSVIWDYFKSCGVILTTLSFMFYTLMNVAQSGTSLWLSDWSNNSDDPNDDKYVRLAVYTALGIVQCKFKFERFFHD